MTKSLRTTLFGFIRALLLALATIAVLSDPLWADTNGGSVRIVNLYRGGDGKPVAVDVYVTAATTPTVTLAFGKASQYLPVPALPSHLLFYATGQRTEQSRLFDLNMQQQVGPGTPVSVAGERVTVLIGPATTDSPRASISVVREWSTTRFALYAPKPGIAIVVGWAGAVQSNGQQERPAFRLGVPGKGCLRHLMPGEDAVTATHFSPFEAPKGRPSIAVYAATDRRCTGSPVAGPREVLTFVQGRTFVFVHGPDPGHVDLVALPIPYPESP